MREIIEQKGKPCCINMITEEDKKFLANLKKTAEKEARAKARAEAAQAAAEAEASQQEGDTTEGAGAAVLQESEEEVDELTLLIQKEDAEAADRSKTEEASKKQQEAEDIVRKAKEEKEATKLEKLREQERDLLDQRSQPIRQYLMDNVVPHLTEGLIELCKSIPEDPTDYLANFLLKRADLIDEQNRKAQQEKANEKNANKN